MKTKRKKRVEHDYYPTPPDAVEALRRQLLATSATRPFYLSFLDGWLDPAAGAGTLLEWMGIDRERRHAIELRAEAKAHLDRRIDSERLIVGADALKCVWPAAHIVANPPFSLLDGFVRRIIAEVDASEMPRLAAVLMPTQWLQAQGRDDIRAPSFFWPLRWRVDFMGDGGGGHYDVAWVAWANIWRYETHAKWLPRPDVPHERWDTFTHILGLPVTGRLDLGLLQGLG